LEKASSGRVLPLSPQTLNELRKQHPTANPADDIVLMDGAVPLWIQLCSIILMKT